ncbi:hypothetical protein BE61_91770 [Bradyrhizobium elkanii USDA 61]|nr:hypothetical protein BE61_91770 [Bradyrhizobium elkanii USDA 61]
MGGNGLRARKDLAGNAATYADRDNDRYRLPRYLSFTVGAPGDWQGAWLGCFRSRHLSQDAATRSAPQILR